jgi:hypothetical protein
MIEYQSRHFHRLFDRGDRLRIADAAFRECDFESCAFSLTQDVSTMSEVRRVELDNCSMNGCGTGPLIASEVRVSNLKTNDLLILWCPYLDRVTFSGVIGKLKINATARPSTYNNERQKPFEDYRRQFYANVEWALDIRDARFKGFDFRGIPGHLVRRDPESQLLIKRERALEVATPGWEKRLDPSNKLWPFMIRLFLSDGDADTVFVAPLGAAKAKRDPLLKGLQELRRIGLAEPD